MRNVSRSKDIWHDVIHYDTSVGTSHNPYTQITDHYGLLPNFFTGLRTRLSVLCRFGSCTSTFSSSPSSSSPMRLRFPEVLPTVTAVLICTAALDLDRITRLLLGSVRAMGSTVVDTVASTVVETTFDDRRLYRRAGSSPPLWALPAGHVSAA